MMPWVVGLSSPRTSVVDLSIRETTSPTSPTGLAAKSSTLTTEIIVEDYLLAVEARSSLDPAQYSKWITEVELYNSEINGNLSGIPGLPGSVFSILTANGISKAENAYGPSFTKASWYSEIMDVEITGAHNLITVLEDILSETVLPKGYRTTTEVEASPTTTVTIPLVVYAPIVGHTSSESSPIPTTPSDPGTVTSAATLGGATPSHVSSIPSSKPPANSLTRAQKLGLGFGLGLGLSLLLSIGAMVFILRRRCHQKKKDHDASKLESSGTAGGAMEKTELDAANTRNELQGASGPYEADGTNRHEIDGIHRHELGGKSEEQEMQRYELDGMDQHDQDSIEV
ncbi:hypothetical protein MMC14_002363 [Varicellaria rhodocarpa]|nr:hypothetical protein [Varicellaria rhodocarpa]